MDRDTKLNTVLKLLQTLVTCSSILGVAGYFFNDRVFFLIAGGICAFLLLILSVLSILTTPPAVRMMYLFHGIVVLLLLVIGCLVADTIGDGLSLGVCLVGIGIVLTGKLFNWVFSRFKGEVADKYSHRFNPNGDKEDIGEGDVEDFDLVPILLDESVPRQERIQDMSLAFDRMDYAFSTLEDSLEVIQHNKETMSALARYIDSGLWKEDFEAMERGEVAPECDPFGVLSEDGLYNFLEDSKELMKNLKNRSE